jgi:hypothetical protein
MQAERTPTEVRERDRRTIVRLRAAEQALGAALKAMPNDKRSAFDPNIDYAPLADALRHVQLIRADAVTKSGLDATSIFGRERALIDGLAKVLKEAAWRGARFAKASHEVSSVSATERGAMFDVQIHVDGEPTGHIARVTVDLDRFEEPGR